MRVTGLRFFLIALATLALPVASATTYHTDRASFDAAVAAATLVPAPFDFDAIPDGTDITGATMGHLTFVAPGSPLIVIDEIPRAVSSDPGLPATSPIRVLSPGGSAGILVCGEGMGIDEDDVIVLFDPPVMAAGIDGIFKSPDGASFVSAAWNDPSSSPIFVDGFIPAPSGDPGYQFVGLVSDVPIGSMILDEFDATCVGSGAAGDEQVGYDSLVTASRGAPPPVPELGSLMLFSAGLAGVVGIVLRRRRA